MRPDNNVSTWLELAVAPVWALDKARVWAHPVTECKDETPWYALTVNGRLLYATGGKLTLLRGRDAVDRFLFLIGLHEAQYSEPIRLDKDVDDSTYCLGIERDQNRPTFGELTIDQCVMVSVD